MELRARQAELFMLRNPGSSKLPTSFFPGKSAFARNKSLPSPVLGPRWVLAQWAVPAVLVFNARGHALSLPLSDEPATADVGKPEVSQP